MTESRTYDLPPFDRIEIATGIGAAVTQGEVQSVRIESARHGLIDKLNIGIIDGKLRARYGANLLDLILGGVLCGPGRLGSDATIFITAPALVGLEAAMGAHVEIDSVAAEVLEVHATTKASIAIESAKAELLRLHSSTYGKISIAGACERVEMKFASNGVISAIELACTDLHVEGSHGSCAEVTAISRVTGTLSSGAYLHLSGRPERIEVKSTSEGKLIVA